VCDGDLECKKVITAEIKSTFPAKASKKLEEVPFFGLDCVWVSGFGRDKNGRKLLPSDALIAESEIVRRENFLGENFLFVGATLFSSFFGFDPNLGGRTGAAL